MRSASWTPSASPAPMWPATTGEGSRPSSSHCGIPSGSTAAAVQYARPVGAAEPRTVGGLRRAWYAGLVATPILGERVVRHPRFVPWFLRLGGQAALSPTRTRRSTPSSSATRPGPRRHHGCTGTTCRQPRVVLLRRAYAGQRPSAPTRLPFGADDFYIPLALLQDIEAHGDDHPRGRQGLRSLDAEERPDLIAERALALFG